uniref:SPIN-DOC-like zinc-finger domain-containing protein n=1 Tax=Pelodiscus sinensis TaxID=13735 RepID=K7F4P2_PELSI
EWENEFLFTNIKDKSVCLICHQSLSLSKRSNLERHHTTVHRKFKDSFPLNGMLRTKKVNELKAILKARQSFFKPAAKGKACTEASFRICHLLAKHKKSFTDGEIIKEAMIVMTDTAQLIFAHMVFKDMTIKEDLLTLLPLNERTRGEDIYNTFKKYVLEKNIPIKKLVSITTDGAPATLGANAGFVAFCRNDSDVPSFVNYHCIIHQQVVASKVMDFCPIMKVVVKILNSIRARPLQHRLFKSLLNKLDAACGELILHADVRWLSQGKVLQRFLELMPEINTFLKSRNEVYSELSDSAWLLDFGFLTDMTSKLSELNCELQGKDRDLAHMLSAVNAFKLKLGLWSSELENKTLHDFPSLGGILEKMNERENFCARMKKLADEFNRRFQELDVVESIVMFVLNPFLQVFHLQSNGLNMEIITMQNDIELKVRAKDSDFWRMVNREKYPLLSSCAFKVKAYFGSTY